MQARFRKILLYSLTALVVAAGVFILTRYVPFGTVSEGEFEVAEVDVGQVVSTLPAEGQVEPESEVLILSPASSIIQKIVKDVGSKVEAGEAIMILDPTPIQEEIDKLKDQLEVKKNNLRKNQLNARSTRVDLDYNVEVKKLRIASLKSELADQEQLLEVGGISPAKYEKTKQELTLAEKDLETIRSRNSIRLQQLQTQEEGLKLQIEIQEKELAYKEKLLKKMIIRAPSDGIILSIEGKVGEKVNRDKLLVKMSNLSNFKIHATTEEDYSEHIRTGRPVIIRLDGEDLSGQVGNVSPVISDKKVEFDVYLVESNHWKLRPNLSVPLRIVREQVDSVLRIKKGPVFQRSYNHSLYRVEGDVAVRQNVTTGLRGDEYIEITSGASQGDRLIISDITLFRNKEQVELD